MDENMKCKNCRYIIEDRENHTFCCTNEKWNNNFDARFQETEPDDFCSKFEEKDEKLSEIEVEILKFAEKLGCEFLYKYEYGLLFQEFQESRIHALKLHFKYEDEYFKNLQKGKDYLIDKLLEDNENG